MQFGLNFGIYIIIEKNQKCILELTRIITSLLLLCKSYSDAKPDLRSYNMFSQTHQYIAYSLFTTASVCTCQYPTNEST